MSVNKYEMKEGLFFKFEEDFVESNIRCIPMIVRLKLDTCGIKLKLAEWSRMTTEDREYLSTAPCETAAEVAWYRDHLVGLIAARAGAIATSIPVSEMPPWSCLDEIPYTIREKVSESSFELTLDQWKRLTELQRFALVKLSNPGHENKNFPHAMVEFGFASSAARG